MLQDNVVAFACAVVALTIGIFIVWGPDICSPKKRKGAVVGLVNLGHTCFLNTLLQALAPCLPFVDWLSEQQQLHDASTLTASLSQVLLVLCGVMATDDDVLVPSNIISALESHGWVLSPGQQDAHELFHVFLTTLEEEAHQLSSKKLSLVNILEANEVEVVTAFPQLRRQIHRDSFKLALSPFQGLLTNQLQCMNCGHKTSLRYDKFDSLSLNLLEQSSPQSQTLPRLLAKFVSTEMVKGVECEGCNLPTTTAIAFKTLRLGKLPSCLCLHISRTTWRETGQAFKRLDYVEFPELLNMNPYVFSTPGKMENSLENAGEKNGGVLSSPKPTRLNHMYQLVSVVVHSGSASSGHFITYRLSLGAKSGWWFTSDTEVRKCSLPEVMKSCAYMLFYVRCNSQE